MISRFNWERTVIGPHGPKSSTTRLVLLTLATHVHRNLECWPSLRTLAAECALSPRSVIDQLEIAAAEGWISKTFMRNERMRHKGNVYRLTLPSVERASPVDRGRSGERPSPVSPTYPQKLSTGSASVEPDAATGERHARSGERRSASGEVENCKPLSSEANFSQTGFKQINKQVLNIEAFDFSSLKGKTEKKSEIKSARQWGEELGIERFAGEHEGAYQARVLKAWLAHRAKVTTHLKAELLPVLSEVRASAPDADTDLDRWHDDAGPAS